MLPASYQEGSRLSIGQDFYSYIAKAFTAEFPLDDVGLAGGPAVMFFVLRQFCGATFPSFSGLSFLDGTSEGW